MSMTEHFCPAENTRISFEGRCNWCDAQAEPGTEQQDDTQSLRLQLADAHKRIAELEAAYLEQVDLTVRIRAELARQQDVRDRFDSESA